MTPRKPRQPKPVLKLEDDTGICQQVEPKTAARCVLAAGHGQNHRARHGGAWLIWSDSGLLPNPDPFELKCGSLHPDGTTSCILHGRHPNQAHCDGVREFAVGYFLGTQPNDPSAADLDANAAQEKAREDTATPATETQYVHQIRIVDPPSPDYVAPSFLGPAVISASVAIILIIGTLWAMYYVIRPKLDNWRSCTVVSLPAPAPAVTVPSPPSENQSIAGITLGTDSIAPTIRTQPYQHVLTLIAKEDVWIKVIEHWTRTGGDDTILEREVKKGWNGIMATSELSTLEVRTGKPNALEFKLGEITIDTPNLYHGGGNLGLYILDGKQLLGKVSQP